MTRETHAEGGAPRQRLWIAGLTIVVGVSCCLPSCCDESGCAAAHAPVVAGQVAQGIVGVAANRSDNDGGFFCFDCTLSYGELEIFEAWGVVETEAAASAVLAGPARMTISIAEGYEEPLPVGSYLACSYDACAPFAVVANSTTTVNLLTTFGPSDIFTFAPDGAPGPASFRVERL